MATDTFSREPTGDCFSTNFMTFTNGTNFTLS